MDSEADVVREIFEAAFPGAFLTLQTGDDGWVAVEVVDAPRPGVLS